MHSYNKGQGNVNAKDMTDDEALAYAEEHGILAESNPEAQIAVEHEAAVTTDIADALGESEGDVVLPTPKKSARKSRASSSARPTQPASGKKASTTESAKEIAEKSLQPPAVSTPEASNGRTESKKRKRPTATEKRAAKERKNGETVDTATVAAAAVPASEPVVEETPLKAPKSKKRKGKSDA